MTTPPIAVATIQYEPPNLLTEAAHLPITHIYAHAHAPNPVQPGGSPHDYPKTNRWVMSCTIDEGHVIRLDPNPTGPNYSIVLIVTKKRNPYLYRGVRAMRMQSSGLTVGSLMELIASCAYDKYSFPANGGDCRFWVCSLIDLLSYRRVLSNDWQYLAAIDAIQQVYGEDGEPLPRWQQAPIILGNFTALDQIATVDASVGFPDSPKDKQKDNQKKNLKKNSKK